MKTWMKALCLAVVLALSVPALAAVSIPFTVNLSESVTVDTAGGTPRIAVDVGGVTRYATYTAGTGTSSLTFTYDAVIGDVDLDGVTLSSPIDLNGGTIKDTAGNDATLTFTPPNTTGVKVNYPSLGMDFVADADGRYTLNGAIYNDLTSFLSATGGTFSRASIGTYFDSTGTLQTASSGTPRFDYDPVTLQPKGILIEEQRTNLLTRSNEFDNPAWGKSQCTASTNITNAPDKTPSAEGFIADSSAINFQISQNLTLPNSTTTFSIYAKAGSVQIIRLRYINFDATPIAEFNLISGNKIGDATGFIENVGGGWWRVGLSKPTGADLSGSIIINALEGFGDPTFSATPTGDMFYLWGAQLEAGAFATSYIPTTTAAVTRAADSLSMLTGGWYAAIGSTIFSQYNYLKTGNKGYGNTYGRGNSAIFRLLRNSASTFNNQVTFGRYLASGPSNPYRINASVRDINGSGSDIANMNNLASNLDNDGPFKTALSYGPNGAALTSNGIAPTTNATVFANTLFDTLRLDSSYDGVIGTKHISKFKYYPLSVSNTQLQLITQ